jgi:hypothetical protein
MVHDRWQRAPWRRRTLGADKGYDSVNFVALMRELGTTPHEPPEIRADPARGAGQEPIDHFAVQRGLVFDFSQESRMLLAVLLTPFRAVTRTQVLTGAPRVGRVPCNGIQFVIAHHGARNAGIDHPAHKTNRADLCWTAVDEVSDEDRLSLGVTPGAGRVAIAERAEKCLQLARLPVNVPR